MRFLKVVRFLIYFWYANLVRSFHSPLMRPKNLLVMSTKSSFEGSSPLVKAVVGGLTSVINLASGETIQEIERKYKKKSVRPTELKRLIKGDFDRGYLFSGEIDPEAFCEDCTFTDPTISFQGLSTFERNIAALKPILDRFVGEREVELRSLVLNKSTNDITAKWRMSGEILLPWKPRIELTGQTVFNYDLQRNGRVVSYYETWDTQAATVLLQLLYPGAKTVGDE